MQGQELTLMDLCGATAFVGDGLTGGGVNGVVDGLMAGEPRKDAPARRPIQVVLVEHLRNRLLSANVN